MNFFFDIYQFILIPSSALVLTYATVSTMIYSLRPDIRRPDNCWQVIFPCCKSKSTDAMLKNKNK